MAKGKEKTTNQVERYEAADVQVLEGLEAVRRRPGMYVGGTDIRALHHLVYEVVDNSVDEALAGVCDRIEVIIHPDSSVTVTDDGRGIPTALHPEKKVSALQLVLTTLHAGAKFGGAGYKVSGGLHGVGVSAVNALSEWMEAVVDDPRDGRRHHQRYERGVPVGPVEDVGKAEGQGTHITFRFDPTIFKDVDYRFETLAQRMREMTFITRGVTMRLVDERAEPFSRQTTFYFEGGIESFVRYLNRNRGQLHDVVYAEQQVDGVGIEVALQYTDAYAESVYAFANTIHTVDGGTHLTGLRAGLTRMINDYARKGNLLKDKDSNFAGEDVREGLTAIVSIKHPDPQFESQTKVKLMNPEVKGQVESVVTTALEEFLERDSRAARRIIEKCLTSSRARAAARKALWTVLSEVLVLLHPIMPFVTQEIWSALPATPGDNLALTPYPRARPHCLDQDAAVRMEFLQETVVAVRNIRGELNISPSLDLDLVVRPGSDADAAVLAENSDMMQVLARLKSVTVDPAAHAPKGSASAVVRGGELYVPLAGAVDFEAELARLDKELAKLDKELAIVTKKLANEGFTSKAPADVVQKERDKAAAFAEKKDTLAKLQDRLRSAME